MAALGTKTLKLTVDGVERSCEVSVAEITNAETEADFQSFCSASAGGGRDWSLHLVSTQDPGDPDSLWSIMWDAAGTTVPVIVDPYGQPASATTPHFSGDVTVEYPDGVALGGEADASSSARFTIDVVWPFTAKPTKIEA